MRLVVLSDTHGFHRGMVSVADGDVLIHCGDFSRDFGSWRDVIRFAAWMEKQPHEHKILCPGNHDYAIHENPTKAEMLFRENGVHMLGQKAVEIDDVVFDGGPWMPLSGWGWGFELDDGEREREWSRIKKVDVLVTHSPPAGILDESLKGLHTGCPILRRRVFALKPVYHLFGHVHESRGAHVEQGIAFVNASSNSRAHFVRDDLNGVTYMMMGIHDATVLDLP